MRSEEKEEFLWAVATYLICECIRVVANTVDRAWAHRQDRKEERKRTGDGPRNSDSG